MPSAREHRPAGAPACRISALGIGGCLLDAAGEVFDAGIQRRVWSTARASLAIPGALEAVPGMNNLMLVFDPLRLRPADAEAELLAAWASAAPDAVTGRDFEIPVRYGGADGEDLDDLASHAGLDRDEVVRRHAGATYTVAAVGAMPGFPYLSGLDPALARGRRASPRLRVDEGAVIIGGSQAGIMPCTAPSGWHVIGRTTVRLFDPLRDEPALLRPGDVVRFTVAGVAS